jgi:hypothetical protein
LVVAAHAAHSAGAFVGSGSRDDLFFVVVIVVVVVSEGGEWGGLFSASIRPFLLALWRVRC